MPVAAVYVGVGARRGVPAAEVLELIEQTLAEAETETETEAGAAGPPRPSALVTVEAKASEPGLLEAAARLGVPLRSYGADALSRVAVPAGSSAAALASVGTPAVAEAAALLAAGPGAVLAVGKRKSARATCAVAYGPA
ncbi:cobyrinic acid a,c-diamide synthase [Streptomyces sp. NRRL B-1677]|uniref:cobalamin biosynthesis protein n=1 Tax=Streptomyces sp. NRRL B-1677 TaxID=2682966 RepID=UPI0018929EBC|nr:cobalamin biosynthesis protein [Streptomyces sp. NRRL B-1677]MBF6046717.1 cobyrinic acid a,c-diamide synthase [Streptomyces sp. NRRL B-1677]